MKKIIFSILIAIFAINLQADTVTANLEKIINDDTFIFLLDNNRSIQAKIYGLQVDSNQTVFANKNLTVGKRYKIFIFRQQNGKVLCDIVLSKYKNLYSIMIVKSGYAVVNDKLPRNMRNIALLRDSKIAFYQKRGFWKLKKYRERSKDDLAYNK